MFNFYEKRGRKIFIGLLVALVVIGSFLLIIYEYDSFNKDVLRLEDVAKNVNNSIEQLMKDNSYNGQIEYKEGDVERRNGEDAGWFALEKSDVIKSGEHVRTLEGGRVIITFEDGSAVRLDENTTVVFDGQNGIFIDMDKGFIYNKVSRKENRKYIVQTGKYEVTALGTEFSVKNVDDVIDVMVIESEVDVKDRERNVIEKVEEGDKISMLDGEIERKKIQNKDLEQQFLAWSIEEEEKVMGGEKDVDVKKDVSEKEEKVYIKGEIKLSGEESSSGVRLHWDVSGVDTSHGFKIVKSTEKYPVYPGNEYQYLSDPHVRDHKWKIDTGEGYHFRVCVYLGNGKCGLYSNDIYVETPSDDEKSDDYAGDVTLSAEAQGDDVKLKWDISGGDAPKGFKIVKSKEKNPVYPGNDYKYISDENVRKYEWKDLKEGKTYYFRVCIYEGGKCGEYSNNVKVSL